MGFCSLSDAAGEFSEALPLSEHLLEPGRAAAVLLIPQSPVPDIALGRKVSLGADS